MKTNVLTALLLAFLPISFAVSAVDSKEDIAAARDKALQSNDAYAIVEQLTTTVGARLAGTPADAKAVQWAKDMLEDSGFDKVWLEPITFPIWQRQVEQARVLAPYEQNLHITALGYSGSTTGEVIAEVVPFASLIEFESSSANVSNKIVFINEPMPRSIDGSGYGKTVAVRYQSVKLAQEKNAAAVLIRSLGTHSHRFAHTGSTLLLDKAFPGAALSPPDADQLQRLLDLGKPVRMSVNIQTTLDNNGQSHNVIAQINGSEKPKELVLIGAHLDSWDLGTGAVDDGAGIGIVVGAAKGILAMPERPKRSIRVVLFGNEEQGLWGAKQYADKHQTEAINHIFASESDFGAGRVWRFDSTSAELISAVEDLLKPLDIPTRLFVTKEGKRLSGGPDIGPIQDNGVETFRLKQDGSDYFDYHHTADDTLDKVDPETLKQNVAAWLVVTYQAANLAE